MPLPVLRKEFVVDRYQVIEARAHGADAVLLIAECLDDCLLRSLYREILDLGMTPLVELHDEENLPRVLDLGATLVGINNRDLKTMTTDLDHVLRLRERVPDDVRARGRERHPDAGRRRAARGGGHRRDARGRVAAHSGRSGQGRGGSSAGEPPGGAGDGREACPR